MVSTQAFGSRRNGGSSTKSFIVYLISATSIAVAATFFLSGEPSAADQNNVLLYPVLVSRSTRVWPVSPLPIVFPPPVSSKKNLEVSWRSALATVIGLLGSVFGTVGGVGGGGIFVPMLNLIVGFDTKSSAALSKCMIMGASASSVWYNLQVSHPSKEVSIIDYDLAFLFQPMLMLGITIGVALSVIFPYWLITVLIVILFLGTSSRSFFKGIQMWKQETLLKMGIEKREQAEKASSQGGNVPNDLQYEPMLPPKEKSGLEILLLNLSWKGILVLMLVWFSFLLLQILKNGTEVCRPLYWLFNILQLPVALSVFAWEAARL